MQDTGRESVPAGPSGHEGLGNVLVGLAGQDNGSEGHGSIRQRAGSAKR